MNKKIAFITDIHLDEQFPIDQGVNAGDNWKTIIDDITSRKIKDIVFGGDIGAPSSNQRFFQSLASFNTSTILGNHDTYNEVIKYYKGDYLENPKELYYSQEHPNYKFIFLDSSAGIISQNQYNWLLNAIKTNKNIVVFIHHPILPINALVDKQYALKERDKIEHALLNISNNVTIFSGHYHFEDESKNENIIQYVTPAGSYQVEKTPDIIKVNALSFGYRILEFNGDSLHSELIMF